MQTTLRVLAAIYLTFIVLCLLIITPALNFFPARYVQEHYARELHSEWIVLNPFKLSLDLQQLALTETDGSPFVSLGESSVNLSLASLWRQGIVLDALRITDLKANIIHLGEGKFNFSDLLPPPAQTEQPASDDSESSIGVTVNQLELAASAIAIEDQARPAPYTAQWENINLKAQDLSTVFAEGRPYALALTGPHGSRLEWQGEVSVAGGRSTGSVSIRDLSLIDIGQIAQPWVEFHIDSGRLDISGDYAINWAEALDYSVHNAQIAVQQLAVLPQNGGALPDTALNLASLSLSGISVDGKTQHADAALLTIDGLLLDGWMEGEQISLAEMFTGRSAEHAQEATPAADDASGAPWSASLAGVQLKNSAINWRSAYTEPAKARIQNIEASAEQLNWPPQGDSPVALGLAINDTAHLQGEGVLNLDSGDGQISYSLEALALPWFNPNLPAALNAEITKGSVNLAGQLTLSAFAPASVALDGAISGFALNPQGSEEVLTGWDAVRLEGLSVNLLESKLQLQRVAIDSYWGYIHIAPDGTVNATNLWLEETAPGAENAAQMTAAESAQDSPDSTAQTGTQEPSAAGDSEQDAAEESSPWQIDIPQITLTDSLIDFSDQSLPIPFRTVVGDLNGNVLGLSSNADAVAKVDIKGSVGGAAPVTLSGTVAPLVTPLALDLALKFNGMDMALLTPYSGTYAGYEIERGIMNLSLQYELADNLLKGNNHIVLNKLKLGKKIDSDKAISAPLELALAIMTDSKGVIDMEIPVQGDVSDPGFQIGGIVVKALLGLIREAVTAPFSLLANLVGSEEDLQHISFPAGSAELGDAGREKLQKLVDALAQRPGINMVINGSVNPESDLQQLQRKALDRELLAAGLSAEEVAAKGKAWEKAISARYEALPERPATGEETTPTVRDQYLDVANAVQLPEGALTELALQRAATVKNIFVTEGGLDPERAVIGKSDGDAGADNFSGAGLEIR